MIPKAKFQLICITDSDDFFTFNTYIFDSLLAFKKKKNVPQVKCFFLNWPSGFKMPFEREHIFFSESL